MCHVTVPDTSYLCGSEVFCSFSVQVSVKFREDICGATAPLPRTTRADSAEGFATVCVLQTALIPDNLRSLGDSFGFWRDSLLKKIFNLNLTFETKTDRVS